MHHELEWSVMFGVHRHSRASTAEQPEQELCPRCHGVV